MIGKILWSLLAATLLPWAAAPALVLADTPDPLDCLAANSLMAMRLPQHAETYREFALLFAFEKVRQGVPSGSNWVEEELRAQAAREIDALYADLDSLLAAEALDDLTLSTRTLHCNGPETGLQMQTEVTKLLLGEETYKDLHARHVLKAD